MQEHEVTWGEMSPWIAEDPARAFPEPAWLASVTEGRDALPATGVPWSIALAYCRDLGGSLPTEEEREWAARGPSMPPYPWGTNALDRTRTFAWLGEGAVPRAVKTADQDRTVGLAGTILYDMLGNAREWTSDLWREDVPGVDESWAYSDGGQWMAVRGVPVGEVMPNPLPAEPIAFRKPFCSVDPCYAQSRAREDVQSIGFRCARAAPSTEVR